MLRLNLCDWAAVVSYATTGPTWLTEDWNKILPSFHVSQYKLALKRATSFFPRPVPVAIQSETK
jgi:hypothetical protein